jgi:hypothetical protein
MTTQTIHTEIKRDIIRTFAVIDEWFDREHTLLTFKPSTGNFSLGDVLERIVHASEYLLKHDTTVGSQPDQEIEKHVADHWVSIMVFNELDPLNPLTGVGTSDRERIRRDFRNQLDYSICSLEVIEHSGNEKDAVKDGGHLEVYQRISFLSIYLKCQIKNMLNIEKEFTEQLIAS